MLPMIATGRKAQFILLTCSFAAWSLANNMTDMLLAAYAIYLLLRRRGRSLFAS